MIAIVITTRNRPKVLSVCLFNFCKFYRGNQKIIVIDDNSTNGSLNMQIVDAARTKFGVPITYVYNEKRLGVANSKNEGFKKCMDADFFFLCDDDIFPIANNWWKIFTRAVGSTGNHHFQYLRNGGLNGSYKKESTRRTIDSYNTGSGWFIFLTKKAFDIVGGFNTEYDMYGYEHVGYSYRIHNMGLTPYGMFLCPESANKYIHSLDMDGVPNEFKHILTNFESSEPMAARQEYMKSERGKMAFEKDLKQKYKVEL